MDKPIEWRGSSLDDLREFPETARKLAGYELRKRFTGLLLETVEHVDRLLKLGDVHHAKPAIGAIDTNLVGAGSNLRKRSPVIGDFAPLQVRERKRSR